MAQPVELVDSVGVMVNRVTDRGSVPTPVMSVVIGVISIVDEKHVVMAVVMAGTVISSISTSFIVYGATDTVIVLISRRLYVAITVSVSTVMGSTIVNGTSIVVS
jgi:hypothetical protein